MIPRWTFPLLACLAFTAPNQGAEAPGPEESPLPGHEHAVPRVAPLLPVDPGLVPPDVRTPPVPQDPGTSTMAGPVPTSPYSPR